MSTTFSPSAVCYGKWAFPQTDLTRSSAASSPSSAGARSFISEITISKECFFICPIPFIFLYPFSSFQYVLFYGEYNNMPECFNRQNVFFVPPKNSPLLPQIKCETGAVSVRSFFSHYFDSAPAAFSAAALVQAGVLIVLE